MLVHHFLKIKKGIQKFKETGDTKYIYKNELDKACFQHDTAYDSFKDLARKAVSEKFLKDKAFNIAKNPKYDGYQRSFASMVYKLFDKTSSSSGITTLKNEVKQNQQLANELHKPIVIKFKKEEFELYLKHN